MAIINDHQNIIHILETTTGIPIISQGALEQNEIIDHFLNRCFESLIESNNSKDGAFKSDSYVQNLITDFIEKKTDFLQLSQDLAVYLYDIMLKNPTIPSADLLVSELRTTESRFIGIFKLDYKIGYSHYVEQNNNNIIIQKTLLSLDSRKYGECAIIDLNTLKIKQFKREYDINGKKENYWSTLFLQCNDELSNNEKLKILDSTTKKITKKYFDDDYKKVAQYKKAIVETIEDTQAIRIDDIADEVFEEHYEIRDEYVNEIRKAGLKEALIPVPQKITKKVSTYKMLTDSGIEINLPIHYINDVDKIEFVNNIDGTVSILIKNIGRILNK